MSRGILSGSSWANQDTIASANTAQLLALGAETTTFATEVRFIRIYASHAIYYAKDATEIDLDADGGENCREYLPATTVWEEPWVGQNVYIKNAVAGETPTVYVVGFK